MDSMKRIPAHFANVGGRENERWCEVVNFPYAWDSGRQCCKVQEDNDGNPLNYKSTSCGNVDGSDISTCQGASDVQDNCRTHCKDIFCAILATKRAFPGSIINDYVTRCPQSRPFAYDQGRKCCAFDVTNENTPLFYDGDDCKNDVSVDCEDFVIGGCEDASN